MITQDRFTSRFGLAALLLAAGLIAAPMASAQTVEDALRFTQRLPASGARLVGMAGASIAGVADPSAMLTNPAGLGYFQQSLFSGSLTTLGVNDQSVLQAPGFSDAFENDLTTTRLGNLASVYRVPTTRGSLVFAVSFDQSNTWDRELSFTGENSGNSITDYFMPIPGEFAVDGDAGPDNVPGTSDDEYTVDIFRPISFIAYETYGIDLEPDRYWNGEEVPFLPAVTAGTVQQVGSVLEEGSMKNINVGGAVEAWQGGMVGVSANLSFGKYHFNRIFDEEDFQNDNDGGGGTTDFDRLRLVEDFESNLVGIGLRAGVSSEVSPGIRVGLTIETPTYYALQEEYGTLLEMSFDNGDFYRYGSEADQDVGTGSYEYSITTPWRLGAGVGLSAAGLNLLADVEWVDWSQMKLNPSSDSDIDTQQFFDGLNRDLRDNYQASANARIGAEYQLGDLFLRGGYALQSDPRDFDLRGIDDTRLDRNRTFWSAGIGYRFSEQFQVDVGWMQERFEDQYAPYTEVESAPVLDEEIRRNHFLIGMKVFF